MRAAQPVRFSSAISNVAPETKTEVPQVAIGEPDKLYSKLEIELRGIDPAVLKSYTWFATTAADHLGIEKGKWYVLITSSHWMTLLSFSFLQLVTSQGASRSHDPAKVSSHL